MKVVLFCGGLGMRLRDYDQNVPKPMVPIGYRPVLWHVMKYYAHFGHREPPIGEASPELSLRRVAQRRPGDGYPRDRPDRASHQRGLLHTQDGDLRILAAR